MNKKGFTLVEIIVSISLISIVVLFLFQIIITIKNLNDNEVNKTNNQMAVAIITREVEKDLNSFGLEQDPSTTCDTTQTNIIPSSAESIKCIKLTYQGINVKNNEGYIIYYKNKNSNKYFLAYKRGKGNIIETQTVREVNVTESTNVEISINKEASDGMQSIKLILPIRNNKDKYDLVINYFESDGNTKRQVNIYAEGGELLEKVGEGSYDKNSQVTIKYSYDTSKYFFESLTCSNITCDNKDLGTLSFTMPNKNVNIIITLKKKTATNYLLDLYQNQTNQGLEVDDTNDHNLRYTGASPKNYISFNNETWRIIGIFNVYNVDTNQNEQLVKIIRNESLGEYVWDTSASNDNSGWGKNDWTQADLKNELNTDYIDTSKTSGTTTWYNGYNNLKTANYNYSNNIKSNYIDKIANIRWNLGTINYGIGALNSYNRERSGSSTWNGKIALMYPSDYSYASTNTSCREDMFNKSEVNETGVCASGNWLHNSQATQLTLATGANDNCTIYTIGNGGVDQILPGYSINVSVRPVLYLKSSVIITGGSGTVTSPYTIG